eukprot:459035-Pelagomonas_calceolata.AAC.1
MPTKHRLNALGHTCVQVRHVFYSGTRITVYESARAKIAAAGGGSSTSEFGCIKCDLKHAGGRFDIQLLILKYALPAWKVEEVEQRGTASKHTVYSALICKFTKLTFFKMLKPKMQACSVSSLMLFKIECPKAGSSLMLFKLKCPKLAQYLSYRSLCSNRVYLVSHTAVCRQETGWTLPNAVTFNVRMQADGRLVAMGQLAAPRYRGMLDALRKITAADGVVGLWRGSMPAVQRAALVNLGELATYDQLIRSAELAKDMHPKRVISCSSPAP